MPHLAIERCAGGTRRFFGLLVGELGGLVENGLGFGVYLDHEGCAGETVGIKAKLPDDAGAGFDVLSFDRGTGA